MRNTSKWQIGKRLKTKQSQKEIQGFFLPPSILPLIQSGMRGQQSKQRHTDLPLPSDLFLLCWILFVNPIAPIWQTKQPNEQVNVNSPCLLQPYTMALKDLEFLNELNIFPRFMFTHIHIWVGLKMWQHHSRQKETLWRLKKCLIKRCAN